VADILESDLAANLILFAAFWSIALGSMMMCAGIVVRRRLARQRA